VHKVGNKIEFLSSVELETCLYVMDPAMGLLISHA